jgi:hypothetical protein
LASSALICEAEPPLELLLLLLPPLELPELLDLLLEPHAASPIDATARSTGTNTPSNLDLDRIFLPFI